MKLRFFGAMVLGVLLSVVATAPVMAATIDCASTTACSYEIDTFIGSGSPSVSSPYGSFTLTQDGANIDVSMTLATDVYFAVTGAGEPLLWDFNGDPSVTLSDITFTGASVGNFSLDSNAGHKDGSGNWDYGITCTGCGSGGSPPRLDSLTFTIDNHILSDFVQNDKGNNFATDLCIGINSRGKCVVTGDALAYDAPAPLTSAPEPVTLSLFGAGLVGAAVMRRRKAKA